MNAKGIKQDRQSAIASILASRGGSTQEEILESLRTHGFTASQATLSRDLREIGAIKVPSGGGAYHYTLRSGGDAGRGAPELDGAVAEFCTGFETIGMFMVIKSTPGRARDLCFVIDRQGWPEIAGTLAGDDTILIIGRRQSDMRVVTDRIRTLYKRSKR